MEEKVQEVASLIIFKQADLSLKQQLKRKIIITPLKYLCVAGGFVLMAKKLNLRRLLANPLKDEATIQKNDKYWRFAVRNCLVVGTLGFFWFAFLRSQINKIMLYKEYQQQIGEYMKWKMDKQVRLYLKRNTQVTNSI